MYKLKNKKSRLIANLVPPFHQKQNRWVWFISGLAHITLPTDNTTDAFVTGKYGLIFAADTTDVSLLGHGTAYPGITETLSIAMPTADGLVPPHSRLHYGPCLSEDIAGFATLTGGFPAVVGEGGGGRRSEEVA